MGQYYRPILTNENGYERVYNRDVDGEYTMAKLMEHSWWYNEFVSTICHKIYKTPKKVIWVGDYADDADVTNEIEETELKRLCKKAWNCKGYGVKKNDLYLDNLFLVNHTKKIYLDCNAYKANSTNSDNWCVHPLPLLTAIGNGLGGGDYRDINIEDVGCWANDLISIEDVAPKRYTEETYMFKEEW